MEDIDTVYFYSAINQSRVELYDSQGLWYVGRYEDCSLEQAKELALKFNAILVEE